MTDTRKNGEYAAPLDDEWLIATGNEIVAGRRLSRDEENELCRHLIELYDSSYKGHSLRERAADIVGVLAKTSPEITSLVIDNARKYAETQHIDDAFPYSPNSFQVLKAVASGSTTVISFLRSVVRDDWGIPRWEAIRTLCAVDDPDADRILVGVIRGEFKPRELDLSIDIKHIADAKGLRFVENVRRSEAF